MADRPDSRLPDAAMLADLMRTALQVARDGIAAGQSPFAAVVADPAGRIIAAAHNRVRLDVDATAHAEVAAIRDACCSLRGIRLTGHVIVTTCEPCPMCAAAIHWAGLDLVAFGARIADAQSAGFRELAVPIEDLYARGGSPVRIIPDVLREECVELFTLWRRGPNPKPY